MNNFTYDEYKNILRALTSSYDIVGYDIAIDYLKKGRKSFAVVRHDVDSNLQRAMNIAHLDHLFNIKSTFFLLVNSELYNLFSGRGSSFISDIYKMGHDIGLHYDPTLQNTLSEDSKIINIACGREIKYFCIHCPASLDKTFENRSNLINVADIKGMKYFADSRGKWRFGYPTNSVEFQLRAPLHLNFHPVWWNTKTLTEVEILEQLLWDSHRRNIVYVIGNMWRHKYGRNVTDNN